MKLTEITQILDLSPIPDAERIEKAKVKGWDVVVQKGLHKVGDTVCFVYPDTLIPKKFIDLNCLTEEKVRLKTVRIRGQFSAGLIIPLSEIPSSNVKFGDDIAELLGIEKWEAPVSASLAGTVKGSFPTHLISKTDEDNYRSFPDAIEELKEERFSGKNLILTVKYDGSSSSFILDTQNEFHVCSRNLELKEDDKNTFWKIARQYDIENKLKTLNKHYGIQGEVYGEGIQKNPLGIKGHKLAIFLIKDLDEDRWLSWTEISKFCADNGFETVDLVDSFPVEKMPTFEELQAKSNAQKYKSGKYAEGLVLRTEFPIYSNVLGKSWWSLKIMNEIYDSKKE